jgi:hypothetical protein
MPWKVWIYNKTDLCKIFWWSRKALASNEEKFKFPEVHKVWDQKMYNEDTVEHLESLGFPIENESVRRK